jgi:hypothetical protein
MSLWQWQKTQEVLRIVTLLVGGALAAQAALLPEQFGEYKRRSVYPASLEHRHVWEEYGLELAETAEYAGPTLSFTVTAYRLIDPTGAFAAFQWQRPADAQSGTVSASTQNGSLIQYNNYLLRFEGGKPHPATLDQLYRVLPNQTRSSLPVLYEYLPRQGRVANSERYLLGPESLALIEPRITNQLASFGAGAEAQTARYRVDGREVQLTIFSYPTPQMAMARLKEFEKLPDAAVRRSGPMLLVVPEARGSAGVSKLLESINYSARATWSEETPKATVQDAAEMILAISLLALGLILASVLLGLFFGGSKFFMKRFGMKDAAEDFTSLHLSDR